MECPIEDCLLHDYARATLEHYEAVERIFAFAGSDSQFEEARLRARQTYARCMVACSALEAHLRQHLYGVTACSDSSERYPH
jgi:hypothetical protein